MQVRWKNLRGFADTGWIDLKPLTILIGPNNTGKSTLYAPLLLLKQTIEGRLASPGLVTRGEYLDGGTFQDLVTDHDTSRKIEFWFRLTDDDTPRLVARPEAIDNVLEASPRQLRISFSPNERDVALHSYVVLDEDGTTLLARNRKKDGRYSIRGPFWARVREHTQTGARSGLLRSWVRTTEAERPMNFLFQSIDPIQFVVRSMVERGKDEQEVDESFAEVFVLIGQFNALLEGVGHVVRSLLSSASYLGPLRAEPRRWYEISGERPTAVGVRGGYAPEVLFRAPRSDFRAEVATWMKRFGFGQRLTFRESEDAEVFSVLLDARPGGPPVNLADSGFGASQLLPVIVEAINTQKRRLLIVEQPEIHLNPRLQAELGDLFALVPQAEGTVIVETHSEHLLMRIRTLLAKQLLQPSDVALYFTERRGGRSHIRRVPISPLGEIRATEWPQEFFGESLSQALALAAAQADRRNG